MLRKKRSAAGFTLLEVMIAIAIMAVAFSAILTSQSGSIHLTVKTKELNLAGWLAQRMMVESEHLLENKPFSEIDKLKIGKFDAPFERFGWKREVKELKFPDLAQPTKEGEGIPEPVRILAKTLSKFLNDSVREMVITVTWQRGQSEQTLVLSTYLIDRKAEFNFNI